MSDLTNMSDKRELFLHSVPAEVGANRMGIAERSLGKLAGNPRVRMGLEEKHLRIAGETAIHSSATEPESSDATEVTDEESFVDPVVELTSGNPEVQAARENLERIRSTITEQAIVIPDDIPRAAA